MNLWLRLIWTVIVTALAGKTTDILQAFRLRMRVLPNDLDTNLHMNNGRYLTLMDLGRLNFVTRIGMMRAMAKSKCIPVLSSAKIRYRIPLYLWQEFDLETRLVCWDEKWAYIEQRFIITKGEKTGAIAAIALVKGSFYSTQTKTTVPTQDLMQVIGANLQSPEFPDYILDWQKAEKSLRQVTAKS